MEHIEREILETDILIVGAGPAGLALAYRLGQLLNQHPDVPRPEILFMEKGSYVGAHAMSGAVMDPRGLAELIPDFKDKGAPLDAAVSGDSLYYLTASGAIKFPFTPPSLSNHGNYVVSINKLSGWLAEQVKEVGIDLYEGLAGFKLMVENDRVTGVQTVDLGIDKDGTPKPNFEPGSIIQAKVTILCEGVHGSLTRMAFEEIPDLRKDSLPQSYLTGVKEVWEVPEGRIKAGTVVHTMGWPQPSEEYGGGWLYAMSDRMVSVGYCVGLNSPDPTNDPHMKFQRYKTNKVIRQYLEGGTMLHYGAKTIPVGGFYSISRLYHDGLMLCGDSAGLLNPARLKGIHLAIKSGMMAADTLFDAVKAGDYSTDSLKQYQSRFDQSWAAEEMRSSRNFHAAFEGGLFAGMFHGGIQMLTGGRGLFDRKEHERDHRYVLTREKYQKKYGHEPKPIEVKFDSQLTFDKLTDVYRSGTKHEEHQPSHLVIADTNICNERCTWEYGNPCQHFCPADVYNMVDDPERPGKIKLELTPSNCVHCKTCDIADPYQVIRWVTPQGGEGPNYTNC